MSLYGWDLRKAAANHAVHGVTFEEAEDAASSPLAMEEQDVEHSGSDERIRITGWSSMGRVLVVIVSKSGDNPRIISARRATKRERHAYEARP
jgi:uncharacterized protein